MITARSAAWQAPSAPQGELSSVESANVRLLGEARLVLIAVAMLVALLEPAGPGRITAFGILMAYAVLSVRELRRQHAGEAGTMLPVNHWVDLACYMPVAAITGGLLSPYTIFLLFPVFTACLRSGLKLGLVVAVVCGATLGAMASMRSDGSVQSFILAVPPAPLLLGLVVAVVIARWAHTEITIVRRLAFCNDVNHVFTPQHDLRRAVAAFCEMVRAYQHADSCVALLKDARSAGWLLFEVDASGESVRRDAIDDEVAAPLLIVPAELSVTYRARGLLSSAAVIRAYHARTLEPVPDVDGAKVSELAQLLEAESLVSLPLHSRHQAIGRLHLTWRSGRHGRGDLEFLSHVGSQVAVMIENMQLVDRLTLEVANEERKKISRDLHDGTMQPYIGLKLALEALHRKVAPDPVLVHEVDDLLKMAGDGINQLRNYVGNLKSEAHRHRQDSLVPAIRGQAEKFSEYYGIRTVVVADGDIAVRGPLFEEVMHVVREALSNIRRHTRARSATIYVDRCGGKLMLRFANDTGQDEERGADAFVPRSLTERARELGGSVLVDCSQPGTTMVSVDLPI